jgi:hypothetical protein
MVEKISFNQSSPYIENIQIFPKSVKVRELCSIKIRFKLAISIPQNCFIIIRFRGGRNNKNDWYFLQTKDPNFNGYAKLKLDRPIEIIPLVTTGKELSLSYFIIDQLGIPKNTLISFSIKDTLAQSIIEKDKKIEILIKYPSKSPILLKNSPTIDIISKKFDHITIICPSIVKARKSFKILLRFEDKYYNLVPHQPSQIKILQINVENNDKCILKQINSIEINEGIKWIEDIQFENEGIYYIGIEYDSEIYESNIIFSSSNINEHPKLYWGYLHGHTNKSDGMRSVYEYFANLIKAGLDFGTSTEHDHAWETSDDDFDEIKNLVEKYNKNDTFVSLFGYEYGTWYSGYGDICIYHKNNNLPILRSDVNKYNSTKKLFKNLQQYKDKVLLIGHHTALRPGYRNWDFFDQSIEKLVEIYSTWGNQEYSYSEGNPVPPRYKFFGYGKYARERGAILEKEGSFVRDALQKGYKLGFVAGGDDHFGIYPSGPLDIDNGIYPSGIMAIWSYKDKLDKEGLWKSLNNRTCYGTTGPRVTLEFWLGKFFMGDIIDLSENENNDFYHKRKLSLRIYSPLVIKKIEIIRNNKIIAEIVVDSKIYNLNYIDTEDFSLISLDHVDPNENEKFCFYYPRIFLSNNQMAWASPIWLVEKNK